MRLLTIIALTTLAYATSCLAMPEQVILTTSGKMLVWYDLILALVVCGALAIITASLWDRLQQKRLARQAVKERIYRR